MSPWYMNFCAPFLPNDPVIQFHRAFQTTTLLVYLVLVILVHSYYKYWQTWSETAEAEKREEQQVSAAEQSSQSQESQKDSKLDTPVSLIEKKEAFNRTRGKIVNFQLSSNESCIELKKPSINNYSKTERHNQSNRINTVVTVKKEKIISDDETEMNLSDIEKYFPIVVGHFVLAIAGSIMYTPYAEQSIAGAIYCILTAVLLFMNAKQWRSATLIVWSCMVMIIIFLLTCFLLEIGQSNYDSINWNCFANSYVSLYSD